MKIELKALKIASSLSEETTAYTATVLVDGQPAFDARNQGHGGCDLIRPLPGYKGPSEAEINAWLAVNEAPDGPHEPDPAKRAPYDIGSACDLERFIGREIARVEENKEWARVVSKVALLVNGQIRTYSKAKFPPTPANLERIRQQIASGAIKGELINGADDDVTRRAKTAFGLSAETDGVMERFRTDRLTAADARYLAAREKIGGEDADELQIGALESLADEQEARAKAFAEQRDAKRAEEIAARDKPLPDRFQIVEAEAGNQRTIKDTETGREVTLGLCDLGGAKMALAHLFG